MQTTDVLIFPGVTPAQMDIIRARSKAQGLILDSTKGSVKWDGCSVDYTYDPDKQTLQVKAAIPFGVSQNEIEGAISSLVRKSDPTMRQDDVHHEPVALEPVAVRVPASGTQQFNIHVDGETNATVLWSLSGVGVSGPALGTVSPAGLYTAPGSIPTNPVVTVIATSPSDPKKFVTAEITVVGK